MKILVIGSGGREHALAWKLAQSPHCEQLYCAPGNGGMAKIAEVVPIEETNLSLLARFAEEKKIDLTVVGPEVPLAMGVVDEFEKRNLKIYGPNKKAAEIERSKVFAKEFMDRHRIPTGRFKVATTQDEALKILNSGEFEFPVVIKADGLAAGKGVAICPNIKRAEDTIIEMMVKKKFGPAGERVIIEERLKGRELSFIVLTDGVRIQPLVTTMDHKAAYDGDKGPNTGGMGAISPSPFVTEKLFGKIIDEIIFPTITRLLEEGRRFKGTLYAGLMLTSDGPKVLEYNCRFGDPETQVQMLRMESDLVEVLMSVVEEDLIKDEIKWSLNVAGCVVLASGGYPGKYEKGKLIAGLEEAEKVPGLIIFHAGTSLVNDQFYTNGGRVLNVCAREATLQQTMKKIYDSIPVIYFDNMFYRKDIGAMREIK
ncbi:MAG: phosphoribosylamine--glycine ligase [Acidobacteriota bacterium]|nr:phosphoribosylamine--glycine ligase [Acidobacteriota bacterium]MDW3229280.1 phosphoribosylamine--glycine ligase [Acidobacteriota bacterium]MDY0231714.1 phosphoribosylamine--glycine ligase [Candidatus Saccharicenans sp.]